MKTKKQIRKVKLAKAEALPSQDVKPETSPGLQVAQVGAPPPEFLLQEAMGEPDRRLLDEYGDTIRVLRNDKRFSFREIAEWLQKYGIECDHNSVYREYTKGLSNEEQRDAAMRNAEEENERA
jgi:hypothetical protein